MNESFFIKKNNHQQNIFLLNIKNKKNLYLFKNVHCEAVSTRIQHGKLYLPKKLHFLIKNKKKNNYFN